MSYHLGETIRHYQSEGVLDKLIHHFIVSGSMEWNESYVERANCILAEHRWQVSGEYVPINNYGEIEDYTLNLSEPTVVLEGRFISVYDADLPGVVLVVDMSSHGQALLLNYEGFHTEEGIKFSDLYDKSQRKQTQSRKLAL